MRTARQMKQKGQDAKAKHKMVKVKVLPSLGAEGGAYLRFISLWATRLCKHSKCHSWGRSSGSTVCLTPMLFPEVIYAKQGSSMYHFSSLWYDSAGHRATAYNASVLPLDHGRG